MPRGFFHVKCLALVVALCLGIGGNSFAAQIASFPAGSGGWQLGTLAVGNIDNDSELEIVVPYRDLLLGQWFLDAYKLNGTRIFSYAAGPDVMNLSPTLYDLDGDDKMEIIITRGTSVVALRGNGSVLWSNQVSYLNYVPQAGYQAVTNGFYMTPLGIFQSNLPPTAAFYSEVSPAIVADFSGSGQREVVTAWKIDPDTTSNEQDFNPFINDIFGFGEWGTVGEVWSGGVIFFNAQSGSRNLTYHIHQLVESGLAVGHASTNRPLNVYVLNDSDSVVSFDKSKPHGYEGNGMLHKMFGKGLKMMSGSYQQGVDVYAADVDGDGLDEVLCPTTQINPLWQPHESMLDDDGALMWRKWKQPITPPVNLNGWYNSAGMIPCNPDHDNHADILSFTHSYEIAFRSWNGVEFVDRPGWPKDFFPFMPTPPVVGDVDGDGQEEIIIGTYNPTLNPSVGNLYVFGLDGTLKQSVVVPGGLKHIPTLADVRGIGVLDVIYRSLAGVVYVQNFGSTGTNLVSWATHRGNAQRDGNLGKSLYPPGTPVITHHEGGTGKASFSWKATNAVLYRIFKAETPAGPFAHIATVTSNTTSYVDANLRPGWQYIYEVGAVIGTNTVHSPPFAILSLLNSNLVVNGGMEENDNSHWDKWNTGDIPWTNMTGSTNEVYQGRQSMEIVLQNQGTTDSLNQYAQYGTPRSYLPVSPGALYSFGGFLKSTGLNQPTTHWFEWTSTKTGEDTNNRPLFPYPDYFTPPISLGSNTVLPWTYLNRTFVLPAGFPNVELRHRFSSASPANGSFFLDNLFFRTLPPLQNSCWTNLVSFGSSWRYFTNTPPANWFATTFNEAVWPVAPAKFGAGPTPTNVATALPSYLSNYYFRKSFGVPASGLEELLLVATCTDDYGGARYPLRIFLNGQELVTSGIEAVSGTGNETKYFDLAPFIPLLRPGNNIMAVMLGNYFEQGWDDVAFDINLKAVVSTNATPHIDSIVKGASAINLSFASPVTMVWRIESCDNLPGPWQLVQVVTNLSGTFSVSDTGQGGRTLPQNVPRRFYRLKPY